MRQRKERKGVLIYFDIALAIQNLNDTDTAQLFRAILKYAQFGEIPELSGNPDLLWPLIQSSIDRGIEQWNNTCEANRRNQYKRVAKDRNLMFPDELAFEAWYQAQIGKENPSCTTVYDGNQQNDTESVIEAVNEIENNIKSENHTVTGTVNNDTGYREKDSRAAQNSAADMSGAKELEAEKKKRNALQLFDNSKYGLGGNK